VSVAPSRGAVETELASRAPRRLEEARERTANILGESIAAGYPAGASLVVVDAKGVLLRVVAGCSCIVGSEIPTAPDTVYDLASLTKVIVTVPLVLALAERGSWSLDDPASAWLPGFPRGDISLRQLLTHTSGLVPHREFYRLGHGLSVIRPAVYREAVDATPGQVCYSDLNYMLLGWALTRCSGLPLARLFDETVARPLRMEGTRFRPPRRIRERVAATELDGDQRLAPGLVWGEVHDGNAWALGGVSGHAGLFAPVDDLGRFARALLAPDSHPVLGPESIAEMTSWQAGTPPEVRALGWRLDASELGPWPASTYWHTGFTGTSLLVAPASGIAVVLLMGGVHPARRPDEQSVLREAVHRAVAESLR
jgi:CubicO group peptidase (beta-lactamase class C family)